MSGPVAGEVVFWRGGMRESAHRVHVAVVDPSGHLVASAGDADLVTFPRSSSKPVQALPLAEAVPDLSTEELAIACASHAGTDEHLRVVRRLLERAGLGPGALRCGTHPPFDADAALALACRGEAPGALHHNCSGKHAGMLLTCVARGWPVEGYTEPDHPLQQEILMLHAELGGTDDVIAGRDGCSVVAVATHLHAAGRIFARFAAPSGPHAGTLERVFTAMSGHPFLIAGRGRLDTELMPRVAGAMSKMGAEGFFGLALRETARGPLGVAIKVEDGGERARAHVTLAVLEALGVEVQGELYDLYPRVLTNFAGYEVGEVTVNLPLVVPT
ncbi:asparaginase [Deinococcus pimensis]|uniref:asparaginase n=1 Tax=Deinococcus pimensis TaxID=309888 RepID=UPI001FDFD221|nr:asparaginase [Deinococcus pimensis]